MKAFYVARKTLLEYLREPLLIGILFAFPVLLVYFYYVAFGDTGEGLASYLSLAVINQDAGPRGAELVEALQTAEFEGKPVFGVRQVSSRREAEIALRERKLSMLIVIPPDLTHSLAEAAGGQRSDAVASVTAVGDPGSDRFVFARSMLDGVVRGYVNRAIGWQETAPVVYQFVPGTGTMSDFESGVPGVIVFGVMFVAASTAMTLVRENVAGTLSRLRTTRLGARDLLLGMTLAQMGLAAVQVPITFGAARLMGFSGRGSLPLAMGVTLLLCLAAVGLGLMTACFARNESEAANLGAVVGVLMVLLCGAMYPMPKAPIATVAGRTIQVYDLLPPTHAAEALRRVLIFGDGIGAIGYQLAALAALSLVTLVAGIGLYGRLRLRRLAG